MKAPEYAKSIRMYVSSHGTSDVSRTAILDALGELEGLANVGEAFIGVMDDGSPMLDFEKLAQLEKEVKDGTHWKDIPDAE